MRALCSSLAVFCACLGPILAPLACADEAGGQSVLLELEPGTVDGYVAGRVPFRDAVPDGTRPLEGLTRPRYARVRMAEAEGLTLCLDADPKGPRLWVDTNFDKQLDDERVTHLHVNGASFTREQFVHAPYRDSPYAVPVSLLFTYSPAAEETLLTLSVRAYRMGTAVLGGRLRNLALIDRNFDARFDDAEKDVLYVDLDGDGEFETRGASAERVPLGEPFRVGEEGWLARVTTPSGKTVLFEPVTPVPPLRASTWPDAPMPPCPALRTPGGEDFAALRARYEGEKGKPQGERVATVRAIGALGTSQALALLQEIAARDPDAAVRNTAIQSAGNPAYLAQGGPWLLGLARTASKETAGSIASALHAMAHPDRLAPLLDFGRASDHQIIAATIAYLAWTRTEEARKAIVTTLRQHPAPIARYQAYLQGARNLEGGPPVEVMLFAADDEYPLLRAEAVRDLYRVGHKDARRLALKLARERPVNTALGTAMARVLGAMGDAEAVGAMLEFAEDGPVPQPVRQEILDQLRYVRSPSSVAVLVKAVSAKEPGTRAIAAEVLASIPQPPVTEALLRQAKKERESDVLALQLEALGDHRDPVALDFLLKTATKRARTPERASATRALARLGLEIPQVRQHFLKLLDSDEDEDRILALDAAAASGDPTLLERVRPSLTHKAWQVRLAAVQALGALRVAPCVPLMIQRLRLESSGRVRDALAAALFRTTGMALYDNAEIWTRWWDENGATFRVPAELPKPPEDLVGGSQAGFYGIPANSERAVFLVDQSGSMSAPGAAAQDGKPAPTRLSLALQEVRLAVERMPDGAATNVILFQSTISAWSEKLRPLDRASREALSRHLDQVLPAGGTNIFDGLELALLTEDVDTIFLLSDGVPGAGKYVTPDDILRAVRRLNQTRRIAIHTVAIGIDSELLRRLAAENNGHYVRR